ncbi:transposable element Tc1 transposase [Trichonephila clavipes]|uniref:Transposable element Tc1 transposase n=1 Tax=Trichonephila clavipes TaxID=2585209 RepID=A0A8X6RVU7_TRICX|nr:transposable element Tc1 transposase [Trichonephila clavipes]
MSPCTLQHASKLFMAKITVVTIVSIPKGRSKNYQSLRQWSLFGTVIRPRLPSGQGNGLVASRSVMSSSLEPLKTRRVGKRCTLNLSRTQTSSRLCGVEVKRMGSRLRCHPRHSTEIQNYQVDCQQLLRCLRMRMTPSTIRADVGVAIVPQTIYRHLAEANLKSKLPFHALPLTPEHRQLRLLWCQARSMWNVTDWQMVVFSDESQFVLGTDDNRVRVWRHPGERYNSPHTVLRHTARTPGVMVWGVIAYDSRSTLIVMRGTLTDQRYVDDVLRPHVGPFLNGLPGAILQQDNALPHTARVAQDFLRHFQTLAWPVRSPDLSPVEHVWDQLKRKMLSCHSYMI